MKTYEVTLPITGHIYIVVEADSEEDAIERAMEQYSRDDIENWEATESGAEATTDDEDDEEEEGE